MPFLCREIGKIFFYLRLIKRAKSVIFAQTLKPFRKLEDKTMNTLNSNENIGIQTLFQAFVIPAAICAVGLTLFWSLPAQAQSFSCSNASTAAEFTVCNSENLQILDEKLNEVFADSFVTAATVPQRQKIARKQSKWVQKRNSCRTDVSCLSRRYQERIRVLTGV